MWRGRHDLDMPVNADRASPLHRIETLDDMINDRTRLYAAALRNKKEFEYILRNLEKAIEESKDAPLFCNNEKRSDDPGNCCTSIPGTHFSCACCASRTTRHREHLRHSLE